MEKKWKLADWGINCPYCGSIPEVLTDAVGDFVYDSDEVRCTECHCPAQVTIVDDGVDDVAQIDFHDQPDCNCKWCINHPV